MALSLVLVSTVLFCTDVALRPWMASTSTWSEQSTETVWKCVTNLLRLIDPYCCCCCKKCDTACLEVGLLLQSCLRLQVFLAAKVGSST